MALQIMALQIMALLNRLCVAREIFMTVGEEQIRFTAAAFAALVAHSPILVSSSARRKCLPRGYELVDLNILEWIRRARHRAQAR